MIDNYILAGIARQAEIEAAKHAFFAQGKRIQILPPAGDGFPPERSDKIDPETVLKRKRKKPTLMERAMLRRMADEL
ncbi:hypothetical protein [Pseudomonas sp. Marseille-QA0332]